MKTVVYLSVFLKNIPYKFRYMFTSNWFLRLLLIQCFIAIGNGHSGSWNSENNISGKPTKHFNCRFVLSQEEENIIKMENKQTVSIPQYENLSITANYIPLSTDGGGMKCIYFFLLFQ